MAQLAFPISSGELELAVLVGHNKQHFDALRAGGHPAPGPLWVQGVIDTGTNVTRRPQ